MQSLGALIAAARRRTSQVILERVSEHRISAQQFWMIITIQETPGISQVEIAERTLSDTASISRALSNLTDRGLVETAPNPEDRRRTSVRLTPAGGRLASELAPVARELRSALVDGMSPTEVSSLGTLLERLIANLDRLWRRAPPQESA